LKKKAKDLTILNVKDTSSFADYIIICSGTSSRHVQAIASSVHKNLKASGAIPLGIEGEQLGQWILMDYDDVIIHIFYEPIREFYDMERLWSDIPKMVIDEHMAEVTALKKGM
jgi:ribosome-associated protein